LNYTKDIKKSPYKLRIFLGGLLRNHMKKNCKDLNTNSLN